MSAQQNPVTENPSAPATGQAEEKLGSTNGGTAKKPQSSTKPSLAQAAPQHVENVVASDNASVEPVKAASEESAVAAAKNAAQNPVANTISIPLQNNTFFNVGQHKRAENGLLIEPVIPFRLSKKWILITRTIVPLIYVPRVSPTEGEHFGLGNVNPQFYLSPANPGKIIWGVGPQLWLPTATDKTVGVNKWGGGAAAVVLTKRGHWLMGALANNVWAGSAGSQGHESTVYPTVFHNVNQMTLNPFIYYNMQRGWYIVSSSIMTSDWAAKAGDRWTVPVGGGFGRVFKIGTQILNSRVQFFKDVKTVPGGQSWTMQTQVQFLFPHK